MNEDAKGRVSQRADDLHGLPRGDHYNTAHAGGAGEDHSLGGGLSVPPRAVIGPAHNIRGAQRLFRVVARKTKKITQAGKQTHDARSRGGGGGAEQNKLLLYFNCGNDEEMNAE